MHRQTSLVFERWVAVPSFEDCYEVSDLGRVRSVLRTDPRGRHVLGRVLKAAPGHHGYSVIVLWANGKPRYSRVHWAVLTAFVGPCPPGLQCRHLDGDPSNNRIDNLEWGTPQQNQLDRADHGTSNRGTRNGSSKLTEDDVRAIRAATGSQTEIADRFGVTPSCVGLIRRRIRWRWLD